MHAINHMMCMYALIQIALMFTSRLGISQQCRPASYGGLFLAVVFNIVHHFKHKSDVKSYKLHNINLKMILH